MFSQTVVRLAAAARHGRFLQGPQEVRAHAGRGFLTQFDEGFTVMDVDGAGLPDIAATTGESAIS